MRSIAIYLAGSIQKGHETGNELFWTTEHLETLKKLLENYHVSFLNPAFRTDNLSDQRSVFGRDMTQVFSADAVIVDARARRGLGVGAEMMWAKVHQIPVLTWAPQDSHYNKTDTSILGVKVKNYVHPFIESLSDVIVSTLTEASASLIKILNDPTFKAKGLEDVTSAMEYYLATELTNDLPMQEILQSNATVRNKLESLASAGSLTD